MAQPSYTAEPSTIRSVGICNLPPDSEIVTDADEEIFLLYTELAGKSNAGNDPASGKFRGLGHVDSRQDTLTIPLEVHLPEPDKHTDNEGNGSSRKKKKKVVNPRVLEMEVQLQQDKTALRSRKGDTGSVVWRASVELAQVILRQLGSSHLLPLLPREKLQGAHVLELGAGTGLLSIIFSPFVRQYTVTDIEALMPLIRKNLALNLPVWASLSSSRKDTPKPGTVVAEPLDWLALHQCSPSTRKSLFAFDPVDLLLIVDCIYHPSLLPALVDTIDFLSIPERTAVLVVVELRAEDVIREFLELWLKADSDGTWEIWHVNGVLEGPYVVWVGWKRDGRT
ncbi:hypothetical protein K474DRAFT_1695160 [Panus rudis PR-1116 ss-1]|nr:hypothetical protein K474DRAFT_1695160 [Panus rudis PR-1116 ss-1]